MTKLKGKARARANKKKKNKRNNDFFARRKKLVAEILKYDDSTLEKECDLISEGEDVKDIFKQMRYVLNATKNGVGLAAPQIGETKRMIVIKPDADSTKITYMINPEIISTSEEKKIGREGCLSYPETFAFIERYTWVEVSYYDENWKKHTVKYKEGDILGIVVQHELEHLNEGHCQVYEWWKDPESKRKELEEKFKPKEDDKEEDSGGYEVVESEDLKKERAIKATKESLEKGEFVTEENSISDK